MGMIRKLVSRSRKAGISRAKKAGSGGLIGRTGGFKGAPQADGTGAAPPAAAPAATPAAPKPYTGANTRYRAPPVHASSDPEPNPEGAQFSPAPRAPVGAPGGNPPRDSVGQPNASINGWAKRINAVKRSYSTRTRF